MCEYLSTPLTLSLFKDVVVKPKEIIIGKLDGLDMGPKCFRLRTFNVSHFLEKICNNLNAIVNKVEFEEGIINCQSETFLDKITGGEFKNTYLVHFRLYAKDEETGNFRPTKKGVALNLKELTVFLKELDSLLLTSLNLSGSEHFIIEKLIEKLKESVTMDSSSNSHGIRTNKMLQELPEGTQAWARKHYFRIMDILQAHQTFLKFEKMMAE